VFYTFTAYLSTLSFKSNHDTTINKELDMVRNVMVVDMEIYLNYKFCTWDVKLYTYSVVRYNEQFLSVKSGCYNKCGGMFIFSLIMESTIIVFTRERLFILFMCVILFMFFIRESLFIVSTKERLVMLFKFTCTVCKS